MQWLEARVAWQACVQWLEAQGCVAATEQRVQAIRSTRKVNAPARASLKLGADGPAACSTGEATRMPPRPTADGLVVPRMVLSGDFVFHLLAAAVSGIAWAW
ncbi:MAG: hypothetical protein EBZ48_13830, partial [Proteobacteria bacterium]|nr:hypothetical protein [Pseudomonadota bacterium]